MISQQRASYAEAAAAYRPVRRPCIACRTPFNAWDRRLNWRCEACTNTTREAGPSSADTTHRAAIAGRAFR